MRQSDRNTVRQSHFYTVKVKLSEISPEIIVSYTVRQSDSLRISRPDSQIVRQSENVGQSKRLCERIGRLTDSQTFRVRK